MNVSDIADWLQLPKEEAIPINGIATDSRTLQPGDLFVAIRGEHYDGHRYIIDAVNKGACAILCERPEPEVNTPQLVVASPVEALGVMARAHRAKIDCKTIALTGSNGKTTVKEMIASMLPPPSFATPGNFNNHLGVPLSLLQLKPDHRFAVFELGANHIGEIAYTVSMVQPQVTLINNIGPAHIAEFGSIEKVAQAKGEIHQGLSAEGTAVINEDDAYSHYWDATVATKNVLRFSIQQRLDAFASNIRLDEQARATFTLTLPSGELEIALNVPGLHNVSNAVAAATCACAIDIPLTYIERGLNQFAGVGGRMTLLTTKRGTVIIDDTYNANLRSSLSALEVLAKRPGRRVLVLGDMGELGEWTIQHHEEIGMSARELKVEKVYTCGTHSKATSLAFGEAGNHFETQAALLAVLKEECDERTTILVKGSRKAQMEKVVQALMV